MLFFTKEEIDYDIDRNNTVTVSWYPRRNTEAEAILFSEYLVESIQNADNLKQRFLKTEKTKWKI